VITALNVNLPFSSIVPRLVNGLLSSSIATREPERALLRWRSILVIALFGVYPRPSIVTTVPIGPLFGVIVSAGPTVSCAHAALVSRGKASCYTVTLYKPLYIVVGTLKVAVNPPLEFTVAVRMLALLVFVRDWLCIPLVWLRLKCTVLPAGASV